MTGSGHDGGPVTVAVPVRVADVGGWTDTWFAPRGAVCHLGVGPGVTVRAEWADPDGPTQRAVDPRDLPVRLVAPDLGDDYRCGPGPDAGWDAPVPGLHPLLEYAVAAGCGHRSPDRPVTVTISSAVPPGASLGTSASVVVGVVAALRRLVGGDRDDGRASDGVRTHHGHGPAPRADHREPEPAWAARAAHRVETVAAGREAGVQDQWAAAHGGAQLLRITDYPEVDRTPVDLSPSTIATLNECCVTVALGSHDSSAVHASVIAALRAGGDDADRIRRTLDELADLAPVAADALAAGDIGDWAATLTRATDAQARLHPGLVGPAHRDAIEVARRHGAIGWKVNGAGGDGGSLTAVFPAPDAAQGFATTIGRDRPAWAVCDLRVAPGIGHARA